MFRFFNDLSAKDNPWPYVVPRDLRCPILLEEAVGLQSTDENDENDINYGTTTVWSGENILLTSVNDYASGLRLITIPRTDAEAVVKFARSRKIALMGVIHGFLVTFLARYVPAGHDILAITPYSMRHITNVSEDN